MTTSPTGSIPASTHVAIPARALPAALAFAFGLMLFLATGFAWPSTIHNATHDTRHALGLPCH
jgi:cobalt transporter subunit CbtB